MNNTSTPVFLLAIQRSGTNMTVWSLEKHEDVKLYNEDNPEAFIQFGLKEYNEIRKLVKNSERNITLFKSLKDTFKYKKLKKAFPNAKFLFLVRNYEDVVGSNLKAFGDQLFEKLATPVRNYILQKHGFFNQAVSQEIKNAASRKCEQLYRDTLSKDSLFAMYWINVNSMFFQLGMHEDDSVYLGFYEDMVKNPEEEFKNISEFLAIEFDSKLVNEVHSQSVKKHDVNISSEVKQECDLLWEKLQKFKKISLLN